ncbi:hypothetical protein [Clostridium sp. DL1XJH146]
MNNNNMNNEELLYSYDNPYNYLKSEYLRLNAKKSNFININLDNCFESLKKLYGDKENELYESDKILFKKIQKISSNINLPIDEQDECTFWLLNRHSKNVIKCLEENNIYLPTDIVLGTLPMTDLNARICSFSKDEILVALNQGLFNFLYLMGRVVTSFYSKIDDGGNKNKLIFSFDTNIIDENLKTNKEGNSKFLEVLILYYVYQNFDTSKYYFERDKKINLSASLWDNAEFFVVSHEYGHIIVDNISNAKNSKRIPLDNESRLYEVIRSWEVELEADQIALQITLTHEDEMNFGLFGNYLGVEFLFACLNIIEEIDNKINNTDFSETHPSAKIRIENLRKYIIKILPEKADNLINGSKTVSYILTKLWDRNKDNFYKRYNLIK